MNLGGVPPTDPHEKNGRLDAMFRDGLRTLFTPLDERECDLPVRCESQGKVFEARITRIRVATLRLRVPVRLPKGAEVKLSRPGYGTPTATRVVKASPAQADPIEIEVGYIVKQLPRGSFVYDLLRHLSDGVGRSHPRIPADIPGKLEILDRDGYPPVEGRIINLGIAGCGFDSPVDWPLGNRINLHAGPLARLRVLTVPGRIAHCKPSGQLHRWMAGIQFEMPIPQRQQELLGRYIAFLAATE
ncbi:MAG TPA: PilZ domain-containing protein [Candidatus Xenobia bacterium]|jgi:hypothetical protein